MTYFLLLLTFFPFDTTIPLVVNKKELKWKYQQKKRILTVTTVKFLSLLSPTNQPKIAAITTNYKKR